MSRDIAERAAELKALLNEASPIIESYTREICPHCKEVCCRQKHGIFQGRDITYLGGLGESVPEQDPSLPQEGPCMFMGESGCSRPRWLRPFRCTWYFCELLCRMTDELPWRESRRLADLMHAMISVYQSLPEAGGLRPSDLTCGNARSSAEQ